MDFNGENGFVPSDGLSSVGVLFSLPDSLQDNRATFRGYYVKKVHTDQFMVPIPEHVREWLVHIQYLAVLKESDPETRGFAF
jgi:hypothetical protein